MSNDHEDNPLSPIPQRFLNSTEKNLAVISTLLHEMKPQVHETNKAVVELKTEVRGMGHRVSKVEHKVDQGHGCLNVDVIAEIKSDQREASQKIARDVEKGVVRETRIESVTKDLVSAEADIAEIKKAPQKMLWGLIGIIMTILGSVGTGVWFLAELNKDVEFESERRTDQFNRIEAEIKMVGDIADPSPVRADIKRLNKAVKVSNGHEEEFNAICISMTSYEKRVLRASSVRRGKRVPLSCLE